MKTPACRIAFEYRLDSSGLVVPVTAMVQKQYFPTDYVVKDIRIGPSQQKSVLCDMIIRKIKGEWVHRESGRASPLSRAAGRAIDEHQLPGEDKAITP
jgi:hypothetical protein